MRTAALPFHLDTVSSPAAQAPEVAFGFAASAVTPVFNFRQANYPPRLLII